MRSIVRMGTTRNLDDRNIKRYLVTVVARSCDDRHKILRRPSHDFTTTITRCNASFRNVSLRS